MAIRFVTGTLEILHSGGAREQRGSTTVGIDDETMQKVDDETHRVAAERIVADGIREGRGATYINARLSRWVHPRFHDEAWSRHIPRKGEQ